MTSLFDQLSMDEPSQYHQRRNAICIPIRKSSLVHNHSSFDGKTTMMPCPLPPPPPPMTTARATTSTDDQMDKMKQLMCTAIHQLRTLAGQLADAEESKLHWQEQYADLEARHQQLMASHHDALVALKTTRRLLLSTRRHGKLDHRPSDVDIGNSKN